MHHHGGVGGGGNAASGKVHHGQAAFLAHGVAHFKGSADFFGVVGNFGFGQAAQLAHVVHNLTAVAHGFNHVARAGFALGANHGSAFGDAAQGFTQIAATAHKGNGKVALVDMIFVIGGGEHFTFVDIVGAHGLKNAGFNKVADTGLGHDGNAHHFHDALDDGGVGHTGHAACGANVGRYAFQGHDCASSRCFGDFGLFGSGDVHDHAAFEHFSEACLQADGALFHIFLLLLSRGTACNKYLRTAQSADLLACIYVNKPHLTI